METEEITLREAAPLLGVSRQRLNDLIRDGVLTVRQEIRSGRVHNLVKRADVLALAKERAGQAETAIGKGRRPKLPDSLPDISGELP